MLLLVQADFAQSLSPTINPLTNPVPGLSPANAPFYGGPFTLTVNGQSIAAGSQVSVGGNALVTFFISTSQLTAVVPTSALAIAGLTPVTVTNTGGAASNAVNLKVLERGDISANQSVNIGDSLVMALTVAGIAKPPLSDSGGDINLSGATNIGDALVLALFSGRLNANMATPTITAVSSPAIRGSTLTITGTGFTTTTADHQVLFATAGNGVVRIAPGAASAGTLTVTVPSQAVTGPMQVYRLDAPMGSPEFPFVVSGTPTPLRLTSVNPFFDVLTGSSVTLTGLGFDPISSNNTVLFRAASGSVAGTATGATATSLTVNVPAEALCGGVSVTTGGTASNQRTIAIRGSICPILLTSILGGGAPGDTLVIEGAGFDVATPSANVVTFAATGAGTVTAPVLQAGGTQLHVRIPDAAVTGDVVVTIRTQASNALTFVPGPPPPPPPVPTLASINANYGIQGQTIQTTVTGTNFVPGATSVIVSGNGVTAGTVTVTSATTLNTTLSINSQAITGTRGVTVATSSGTSNAVTFTVLAVPTLASINASTGIQGQTIQTTLTGTDFIPGATSVIVSGSGVTAGTITVTSATTLNTTLSIDAQATAGTRGVTVTTSGGTSNAVTFTVLAVPTMSSISPAIGVAGTAATVTVTGSDFLPGTTMLIASGTDVTVSGISVINATTLTAVLTIANGATSGFRNVRVTTAGGPSNTLKFTLGCAIAPISGLPGTTVPVTVTGAGFGGATTLTISGTGIAIGGVSVTNATTLIATLTIAGSAPVGARGVTVTTGGSSSSVTFWVPAAQVTDNSVRVPPDYYSFLPPANGKTYVDPIFGSTIKRMSDATVSPDVAYGTGVLPFISDEYSTMNPFNSDNSKVLALHFSYFGLYHGIFDAAGNFIKNLPFAVSASTEPRWSRTNPNILYFINGNQLKKLDVSTDVMSVVHIFAEYTSISGKGESDISFDGDHFVLIGSSRFVFVYEISSDSRGPAFDTGGRPFDSLFITPDNNVTITWYDRGTARFTGIELFDRNMKFLRQVTRASGHMDVTRDTNGDEVLVWANSNDPQGTCPNSVVKVRLSTGQQTCLLALDQSLALHISGTDNTGWFFMDTYAPGDPNPSSGGWAPYSNEILEVKLDGTQVRRLAHHRSRPFDTYNYEPRVSTSRDGSRIVFTSNYGLQSILGFTSLYSDIYLIVLP